MRLSPALAVILALALPACDSIEVEVPKEVQEETVAVPPMPPMPADWTVVGDVVATPEQVKGLSERLGAAITGVRNTVYNVDGKRFQVNLILVPSDTDAAVIVRSLEGMKAPEAVLRRGLVIYELVGDDDTLPLIPIARKQIDGGA